MNISKKTRTLTIAGILTAITFILGLTPLGFIPIPGFKLTILCIPVLIGVILEGLGVGLWLGFIFGLTSLIQMLSGSPFVVLLNQSVPKMLLVIFIPRLLVPLVANYVHKAIKTKGKKLTKKMRYGIVAFVGSMTNTVFFLSFIYVLFNADLGKISHIFGTTADGMGKALLIVAGINGGAEALAAVIIVSAVCIAVNSNRKKKELK